MALAFATSTPFGTTSGGSTITFSSLAPTAGSDRVALIKIAWEKGSPIGEVSSIAWAGGGSGVLLGVVQNAPSRTEFWYILETGFPGSAGDLVVTLDRSISNDLHAVVEQYTGALQDAPDALQSTTFSSSPVSAAITTAVAGCILSDVILEGASGVAFSADDSQTITLDDDASDFAVMGGYVAAPTATTYNVGYSYTGTASAGIYAVTAIRPAAGGGGGGTAVPVFWHHYSTLRRA